MGLGVGRSDCEWGVVWRVHSLGDAEEDLKLGNAIGITRQRQEVEYVASLKRAIDEIKLCPVPDEQLIDACANIGDGLNARKIRVTGSDRIDITIRHYGVDERQPSSRNDRRIE